MQIKINSKSYNKLTLLKLLFSLHLVFFISIFSFGCSEKHIGRQWHLGDMMGNDTLWFWGIILSATFYPLLGIYLLRYADHIWQRWVTFFLALPLLVVPLLLPEDWPLTRGFVTIWVGGMLLKLIETGWNRITAPEMGISIPRYLIWFHIQQDTSWPKNDTEKRENQQQGVYRLKRGFGYLVLILIMIGLATALPISTYGIWVQSFWGMWLFCFIVSAITDFASVPWLLMGVGVTEILQTPIFARSPRDFWSRRWNLWIKKFCHRNIFKPIQAKTSPLIAVSAVFLFSAILHEILVAYMVGHSIGYMSAFFILQGLATMIETRFQWPSFPRSLAVGLHTLWMSLTIPLFFFPFRELLWWL